MQLQEQFININWTGSENFRWGKKEKKKEEEENIILDHENYKNQNETQNEKWQKSKHENK